MDLKILSTVETLLEHNAHMGKGHYKLICAYPNSASLLDVPQSLAWFHECILGLSLQDTD